jgi:hypothetical protein
MTDKKWQPVLWIAISLYCIFAILQIAQEPGLEDDEAIFAVGTVHMLHLPHREVTVPHDPDTWIHVFKRWFPLMTVRYAGPNKEYLFLPIFKIFGPRTSLIRLVSILLGAIGIWGMAELFRRHIGVRAAAAFALLMAVNPAYVDFTAFDNDAVAISMATLGLLCLALSHYLVRKTAGAAFIVGAAVGLMIWARANLLWTVAAIFVAGVIVAFKQLPQRSHWIAATAGGIAGGSPFVVYQIISGGGTWQALAMFTSQESLSHRLLVRSVMFAEAMLIDREHRAMWNGPAMPDWQNWLFPMLVIASCLICLMSVLVWARAVALAFLVLGVLLFFSSEQISEHHLFALFPFAVAMVVLAGIVVANRFPASRYLFGSLAAVYLACALYWQLAAIQGLRKTGGIGIWSDGINRLAQHLQVKYPNREINILDWGLDFNLYVVTNGRIVMREIFADATREQDALNRPWADILRKGGVFVLNAPEHRQIPAASEGFMAAFDQGHPSAQRTTIAQRDGTAYAEVIEIEPNTTHAVKLLSSLQTADPKASSQLEGFYEIEDSRYRWTKRNFGMTLIVPDALTRATVQLDMQIYIPDAVIQKLGSIRISAQPNDHAIEPETFTQSGTFNYVRDLPADWLRVGPNRFNFQLDKSVPPSASDDRELGVIVIGASL